MSGFDKVLFQQASLLGRDIPEVEPFLQIIACMNAEYAELLVYTRAYKRMFPEDKELNSFLTDQIEPIIKELALCHWQRNQLTDMAIKLGQAKNEAIDLSQVEEEEEGKE